MQSSCYRRIVCMFNISMFVDVSLSVADTTLCVISLCQQVLTNYVCFTQECRFLQSVSRMFCRVTRWFKVLSSSCQNQLSYWHVFVINHSSVVVTHILLFHVLNNVERIIISCVYFNPYLKLASIVGIWTKNFNQRTITIDRV